jgi:hypothetical protein
MDKWLNLYKNETDAENNASNSVQSGKNTEKKLMYKKGKRMCDFFNFVLHLKIVTEMNNPFV